MASLGWLEPIWFGSTASPRIDGEFLPAWAVYSARGNIIDEVYSVDMPTRSGFVFEICTGIIKITRVLATAWTVAPPAACLIPASVRSEIKIKFPRAHW